MEMHFETLRFKKTKRKSDISNNIYIFYHYYILAILEAITNTSLNFIANKLILIHLHPPVNYINDNHVVY